MFKHILCTAFALVLLVTLGSAQADEFSAKDIGFRNVWASDQAYFNTYPIYRDIDVVGYTRFFPYFYGKVKGTQAIQESLPNFQKLNSTLTNGRMVVIVGHYYASSTTGDNFWNSLALSKWTADYLVHSAGYRRNMVMAFGAGQCQPMFDVKGLPYQDSRVEIFIINNTQTNTRLFDKLVKRFARTTCVEDEENKLAEIEYGTANTDSEDEDFGNAVLNDLAEMEKVAKEGEEAAAEADNLSAMLNLPKQAVLTDATAIETVEYMADATSAIVLITGNGLIKDVKLDQVYALKRIEVHFPFSVNENVIITGKPLPVGIVKNVRQDLDALDRILVIDLEQNPRYIVTGKKVGAQLVIAIEKVL